MAVLTEPRKRVQYFRLDEQDALLPEIQPENGLLDAKSPRAKDKPDENPENHQDIGCPMGPLNADPDGSEATNRGDKSTTQPTQLKEEPLPSTSCFASAVAAALAAKETSSCMESIRPSKRDKTGVPCMAPSPKLKELPALRGQSLTSRSESGYFTPRGDFHGNEGGFFTPRDPTEATPENLPKNAPSQMFRSSSVKNLDGVGRCVFMNNSPADGSLLAKTGCGDFQPLSGGHDATAWRGWQLQATPSGAFYFSHPSGARQWDVPPELTDLLGEWREVNDGHMPYWSNDRLGASCWKDPRSCASIHQAALDGNLPYLQLYLFAGGSIHATNSKGRSALHTACAAGQTEVIALLLANQAEVHLCDHTFSTPLHWACRYGHASAVQLLLQAGADIDSSNMLGDTPAHEAAGLGQVKVLQELIEAGANLHVQNAESRKPSEVAAIRGWLEAQALLEHFECLDQSTLEDGGQIESRAWLPSQEPVSPALKLVRAARPVLRGVQWLANRVLGEPSKGGSSLQPDDSIDCASEASEDSEDSWYPSRGPAPDAYSARRNYEDSCFNDP